MSRVYPRREWGSSTLPTHGAEYVSARSCCRGRVNFSIDTEFFLVFFSIECRFSTSLDKTSLHSHHFLEKICLGLMSSVQIG